MSRYLTDLADVLRAAGLTVVEVDGWQSRARSSGGYADGAPNHLMIHHTASPVSTDGQRDVDFIVFNSSVRPVSNLYTDRRGVVWVCAAGATNTNGKGSDTWGGGVPDDRMNLFAVANEIANDGVGEPYPIVQQDAVIRSSVALCDAYSIAPHCVRGHFEWAPSRKVDPAGPSRWTPTFGRWNMDAFRHDISLALDPPPPTPPPPPPPIDGDDDMATIAFILQPPPQRLGSPWLVVVDGDVRPATSYDLASKLLPVHQETNQYAVEQYDTLRKASGV